MPPRRNCYSAIVDGVSVLERFDEELRNDPPPEAGTRFETVGGVVRAIGHYAWIIYSKLSEASADRAIAEQVAYFTSLGQEVEWKVYGHDRPPDLGARLAAHGFEAGETETLMAFDLGWDMPPAVHHPDIEIRRVRDDAGLNDLIAVSSEAFGRDPSRIAALSRARLHDPTLGLFVAYADGEPAAAGRLEMPPGRSFAGLWGSGTRPAFRGRGIYRALVAARAREAKRLGFRYLNTDARDTSRPILERLGFVPVTTITAWILQPL
jgi:GNAT superfamily N-acetyltransferase